jgi:OOP family OmpA-OmpF porin
LTSSDQTQEHIPEAVWWLLGAFGVVVIVALFYGLPREQEELTTRAVEAVRNSGIAVDVAVNGRDVYLAGGVATFEESQTVVAAVNEVEGVRFVHADITYLTRGGIVAEESVSAELAADPEPALTIALTSGVATLRGRYPEGDAVDDLVSVAIAVFGEDRVVDSVATSAVVVAEEWIGRAPEMLPGLAELSDGTVAIGAGGASIAGEVDTPEAKERIGLVVEQAIGDFVVVSNNLVVVPVTPVEFRAAGAEGEVLLVGVLPDEDIVAEVGATATEVYGEENVTNLLEVGAKVERPPWLESLPGVIATTRDLESWSFDITSSGAVLSARGPDDESLELVAAMVEDLSVLGLEVAGDVQRTAASVADELTGILAGSATFESGSTRLSAAATELLDEAAVVLLANPATQLAVEGHTDDWGDEATNLTLSQARADAVVGYLVAAGVAEDRLIAVGIGESDPIADNTTEEGRAANRRIVFVVREDGS